MRLIALFTVFALANICWAQQGTAVDVQAPGVRVQTDNANQYNRNQTTTSEKRIVRASELIGLNVQNHADEAVGEINDIVIDPNDGRVRYIALSAGGVLGVGDELFAIPWTAFECRKVGDEHKVVLNVDKETLQNAKGFNQDNWPDMANERWQMENDRIFQPRATDRRATTSPGVR
jgi:sporulation protein YlmC with PRC-barrel domain